MTYAQAADLFNLLRAAYPDARGKVGQDTADLWLGELRRLDHGRGVVAVRSLIAASKFWPSLAELHEQCRIIGEQQARVRREQERREAEQAVENMPMPPLHEIPAVAELLRRFSTPLPLDRAAAGECDDCGRSAERYRRGRFRLCADCAQRRLRAAARLDQTDNTAAAGAAGTSTP